MRKDLINLYELQLQVKSGGNRSNERVRTFLNEVFKIGFTNDVSDIFPMDDFLYGDFLILDKEFIYKEYLDFLNNNEEIDDVLYHIAENDLERFNALCIPSVQNIDDINQIYKTKKETEAIDVEENFSMEASMSYNFEERDDNVEMHNTIFPEYELDKNKGFLNENFIRQIREQKGKKEFSNEYFIRLLREKKELDEVNYIENKLNNSISKNLESEQNQNLEIPSFLKKEAIDTEPELIKNTDIHTDIFKKMGLNTNDHIKYNIYARMRIEDYVNDISKLRTQLSSVFSN